MFGLKDKQNVNVASLAKGTIKQTHVRNEKGHSVFVVWKSVYARFFANGSDGEKSSSRFNK